MTLFLIIAVFFTVGVFTISKLLQFLEWCST